MQTDETGEQRDRIAKLVKDFPNLMKGGGLLPTPPDQHLKVVSEQSERWRWEVTSPILGSGKKEIPCDTRPYLPRLEGSQVLHPCCGTACAVLSAPLQSQVTSSILGAKRM